MRANSDSQHINSMQFTAPCAEMIASPGASPTSTRKLGSFSFFYILLLSLWISTVQAASLHVGFQSVLRAGAQALSSCGTNQGTAVGPERNGFCAMASSDTHAVCVTMPHGFCENTGQTNPNWCARGGFEGGPCKHRSFVPGREGTRD